MTGIKKDRPRLRWPIRIAGAVLLLLPFIMIPFFWNHFKAHFTGGIEGSMITGQWHIVLINIILFTSFLIPLTFRKKVSWKEFGLVTAFFVSLFVEMYGIPLTVMFASRAFHASPDTTVNALFSVELWGIGFSFTAPMAYGALLMVLGTAIVIVGWITLYRRVEKEGLVTTGVYSISRHPQYLGFMLVIYGWMVGWTTLLTVLFGAILLAVYIRVCMKEEKEMGKDHDYAEYRKRVPFII
ncbi:MAG: methyltransferase family protein [Thermoplasmatota archaeon]